MKKNVNKLLPDCFDPQLPHSEKKLGIIILTSKSGYEIQWQGGESAWHRAGSKILSVLLSLCHIHPPNSQLCVPQSCVYEVYTIMFRVKHI